MLREYDLTNGLELVLKFTDFKKDHQKVKRYSLVLMPKEMILLDEDGSNLFIVSKTIVDFSRFAGRQEPDGFYYSSFYVKNQEGNEITGLIFKEVKN